MQKFFIALLPVIVSLLYTGTSVLAQTPQYSYIPTGSSANTIPFKDANRTKCQFLVLASELPMTAGVITKIYFQATEYGTSSTTTFTDFNVKIGMTTLTNMPSPALPPTTVPYITA